MTSYEASLYHWAGSRITVTFTIKIIESNIADLKDDDIGPTQGSFKESRYIPLIVQARQ
jgi:hypothetical protein